jgi:hypothetical protein
MELMRRIRHALIYGSACVGLSIGFVGAMLVELRDIRRTLRRRRRP